MTKRLLYLCAGLLCVTLANVAGADTLLTGSRDSLVDPGSVEMTRLHPEGLGTALNQVQEDRPWLILAQAQQGSPCEDPRYLQLKGVPLDSMTQREYEYFTEKDKACTEFNRLQLHQPPASPQSGTPQPASQAPPPQAAPANGGMGAGSVVLISILGTVVFLVILGALAQ